jgi:hypothetical protein
MGKRRSCVLFGKEKRPGGGPDVHLRDRSVKLVQAQHSPNAELKGPTA